MTIIRNALLGSAALLATGVAAQAADLPLAEPVEYVRICDTWGAGYFYIPGTQTCLQISGYVRSDLRYAEPVVRGDDTVFFRNRARLNFDARTQTEIGTLRSYMRLQGDWSNNGGPNSSPFGGGGDASGVYVEQAFVQFAGVTAGLTNSFFDFYASANILDYIAGSDIVTNLVGYTATFGSGFSASLAIEDRSPREYKLGPVAGTSLPDVVARIRVDQAWGAAQLSGAVHQLRDNTVVLGQWIGTDTDYGFAIQGGVTVNLPFFAAGDTLTLQAAYADGAISYLGAYDRFGLAPTDATLVAGPDFDTSRGFSVVGELLHYWTPTLRSALAASYVDIDATTNLIGVDDYREFTVVGNIVWSPVANLDLGLEVAYTNVDAEIGGFDATPGVDSDAFVGLARIQRNF